MKRFLLIFVAIFAFAISGTLTYFYNRTDDLSLRYNLWKIGFYLYPFDHISHAIISDKNRYNLVNEKTKCEIKIIFPNAHEESVTEGQKQYLDELRGKEYLWIGESNLIIFLKDGLGNSIDVIKG